MKGNIHQWSDVEWSLSIEVDVFTDPQHGDIWQDIDTRDTLPDSVTEELTALFKDGKIGGVAEIVLTGTSSGYDDPGSMYGGTDHLGWPPEYEDIRICESACVSGYELSQKSRNALADQYIRSIMKIDVCKTNV